MAAAYLISRTRFGLYYCTLNAFTHLPPVSGVTSSHSTRAVTQCVWPAGVGLGNAVQCPACALRALAGRGDRRMLLLSILYRLVRCLLGLAMVLVRRDLDKDAEPLILRHENAVFADRLRG
jgi:hypothetical protein